jgi:hypothetical protein
MPAWNWTHGSVVAGNDVTVKVNAAPCQPVSVRLYVHGALVDSGTIPEGSGSVDLHVPTGSQGQSYELVVSCNGQSDSKSGIVG